MAILATGWPVDYPETPCPVVPEHSYDWVWDEARQEWYCVSCDLGHV